MEKKVEEKINDNGIYVKVETTTITPEDGFVHETDINKVGMDNYGKYHKGYKAHVSFTTNDPRITRPFVYGVCVLFFGIGIMMLLISLFTHNPITILMGFSFTIVSIFTFNKSKKDIDKIENELKAKGNYNEKLSVEEKNEYKQSISNAFEGATKKVFTKSNFDAFLKMSLPIYSIICIIAFLLISIFISVILGIIILGFLILCGYLYYLLISKIFKY